MKGPKIGKLNRVKMFTILPKLSYRINVIPIKISARYLFCRHRKASSKIYVEKHRPQKIAKTTFPKKNKMAMITLLSIMAYYIVQRYNNQDHVVLVKRHICQWNRTWNPETYPPKYAQLTFEQSTQVIQWRKNGFLNKWCQQVDIHRPQTNKNIQMDHELKY